jgi:hypothetical protein
MLLSTVIFAKTQVLLLIYCSGRVVQVDQAERQRREAVKQRDLYGK